MTDMDMWSPGRLYLDADGVVLTRGKHYDSVEKEVYSDCHVSPLVCQRLGRSGLELVWLTTWEDSILTAVQTSRALKHLEGGRVLRRDYDELFDHHGLAIAWKIEALVRDQLASPTSFVWVDDQITGEHIKRVLTGLQRPQEGLRELFISPSTEIGLVGSDLEMIEDFVKSRELSID